MFEIEYAEGDEAIKLLLDSDDYLKKMSPLERGLRIHGEVLPETNSIDELRTHLSKQTMTWTADEKAKVGRILETIKEKLAIYDLKFPDTIKLVKTTGLDDIRGCSGYCRAKTIVMADSTIERPDKDFEAFMVHELFHIQSQVDPDTRYRLYAQLGFTCTNEIQIPPTLASKKITNPDAQDLNVVITVNVGGESAIVGSKSATCVPIILFDAEKGGSVFNCLDIVLLEVTKESDSDKYVVAEDYKTHRIPDVSNFFDQIGKTHYYFHPEEVLATRFEEMVRVQNFDDGFVKMLRDTLVSSVGLDRDDSESEN